AAVRNVKTDFVAGRGCRGQHDHDGIVATAKNFTAAEFLILEEDHKAALGRQDFIDGEGAREFGRDHSFAAAQNFEVKRWFGLDWEVGGGGCVDAVVEGCEGAKRRSGRAGSIRAAGCAERGPNVVKRGAVCYTRAAEQHLLVAAAIDEHVEDAPTVAGD